jgi:hypothetical protein
MTTSGQPVHEGGRQRDDALAISNLVAESHFLVDTGRWGELADEVFATEEAGVVPEADFGFDVWRGSEQIRTGFDTAMPRFAGAVHAISNLHLTIEETTAVARYYVQGWHWVGAEHRGEGTDPDGANIDFLVLGVMTDDLIRQTGRWRVLRRRLSRLGPDMALGRLPAFLRGLGTSSD